jgi:hypothetical protein
MTPVAKEPTGGAVELNSLDIKEEFPYNTGFLVE